MKFKRGYEVFHEQVDNSRNRVNFANCFSCKYFYEDFGDHEELCQNSEVLRFDVCRVGNRVFCSFWKGVWER